MDDQPTEQGLGEDEAEVGDVGLDPSLAFDREASAAFASKGEERTKQAEEILWERLSTDTDLSFKAFRVYRDLGAGRSLAKAGRELGKKPGYVRQLEDWSKAHDWQRRVAAWDAEEDRLWLVDLKAQRRDMAKRHAEQAKTLAKIALLAIEKKFGPGLKKLTSSALTPREMLRFIESAAKLERIALGEPSDIVETQLNGGNVTNEGKRPIVPLTFAGRTAEIDSLLEVARAREAVSTSREPD